MMAASTAEPPVGASTCTSGNQVWTGHIGILTAKAAKKASKNAELAAALPAGPKNPPKVHLSEAVQDGARQAMLKAKGSKAKAEPVTA